MFEVSFELFSLAFFAFLEPILDLKADVLFGFSPLPQKPHRQIRQ